MSVPARSPYWFPRLNSDVSNIDAVVVSPERRMANVSNVKPPKLPGALSVNVDLSCAVVIERAACHFNIDIQAG